MKKSTLFILLFLGVSSTFYGQTYEYVKERQIIQSTRGKEVVDRDLETRVSGLKELGEDVRNIKSTYSSSKLDNGKINHKYTIIFEKSYKSFMKEDYSLDYHRLTKEYLDSVNRKGGYLDGFSELNKYVRDKIEKLSDNWELSRDNYSKNLIPYSQGLNTKTKEDLLKEYDILTKNLESSLKEVSEKYSAFLIEEGGVLIVAFPDLTFEKREKQLYITDLFTKRGKVVEALANKLNEGELNNLVEQNKEVIQSTKNSLEENRIKQGKLEGYYNLQFERGEFEKEKGILEDERVSLEANLFLVESYNNIFKNRLNFEIQKRERSSR